MHYLPISPQLWTIYLIDPLDMNFLSDRPYLWTIYLIDLLAKKILLIDPLKIETASWLNP